MRLVVALLGNTEFYTAFSFLSLENRKDDKNTNPPTCSLPILKKKQNDGFFISALNYKCPNASKGLTGKWKSESPLLNVNSLQIVTTSTSLIK